ncbi:hypothetical protein MMC13_008068 [Lambiella insularis]|nr:hypothetical protein [Lambiella insularis]
MCAGKNNIEVQPKSGGHSYASYSLGGQNGSMVVDLESFQAITVDANGLATVGGGVSLGNMALGIYNRAQRALRHGTYPGVGIGGHALHGGFGYSSRAWGLALDAIVALDVVLPNGSFVHATETAYPQLYYALRGAASDFGSVTMFCLQTLPAPELVVNWQFRVPGMYTSAVDSAAHFLHIQAFAMNASVVDRNPGLEIHLDGHKASRPRPPHPSYPSTGSVLSPCSPPQILSQQPTTNYSIHDDFFAKSNVTPESGPLTRSSLESLFAYIIARGVNATNPWFSIINLYGGPDSQINAQPPSTSANVDRSALWVFQNYGYTGVTDSPFPGGVIDYITGMTSALILAQEQTPFTAYQNYVDPTLSAGQARLEYYGAAVAGQLVELKNEVDPGRVLWNPQSL